MKMIAHIKKRPLCYARSALILIAVLLQIAFFSLTWMTGDNDRYYGIASALLRGQGYVSAYLPGAPPENVTPPGYPFLLALVMKIFGASTVSGQIGNVLLHLLTVLLVFQWALQFKRVNVFRALAITVIGMFSVGILAISCWHMSEMSYLFFTFLVLLLYGKRVGNRGWIGIFFVGLLTGYAYLIRSVGVALVLGFAFHLLFRREWKMLPVLFGGVILVVGPWLLRNALVLGSVDVTFTHAASWAGASDGMSYPWARAWVDFKAAFPLRFFNQLPAELFYKVFQLKAVFASWGLAWLFTVLQFGLPVMISIGFIRRLVNPGAVDFYWVFYWLVICANPIPPVESRFVMPIQPIAALYLIEGVAFIQSMICRFKPLRRVPLTDGVAALVSFVSLSLALIAGAVHFVKEIPRWPYAAWAPQRYFYFRDDYMSQWGRYAEAALWIGSNMPPETVVSCRKPQHTFIMSGRQGWRYDGGDLPEKGDEWDRLRTMALKKRPAVILEDAFGSNLAYGAARRQVLAPLLAKHESELELVYQTDPPVTRVWRVKLAHMPE